MCSGLVGIVLDHTRGPKATDDAPPGAMKASETSASPDPSDSYQVRIRTLQGCPPGPAAIGAPSPNRSMPVIPTAPRPPLSPHPLAPSQALRNQKLTTATEIR